MKTYKITTTGLSLAELKVKYKDLFYNQSWYESEKFYTKKPEAGTYEFSFDRDLCNKTYEEQLKKLPKDFKPVHPAIITEALIIHFKETGERLLENWYVRTNTLVSGGDRVCIGYFGAEGLGVDRYWGDYQSDYIGVSAARKLDPCSLETPDSSESLKLEYCECKRCPKCNKFIR